MGTIGIVGHKGFIGSHLLTKKNHIGVDRRETTAGRPLSGHDGYVWSAGWPGTVNVDDVYFNPIRSELQNVLEPLEFAHRCFLNGRRFLFISSGHIFNWTNQDGKPWTEDQEPNHIGTPYTLHKWQAENRLRETARSLQGDLTIFRVVVPFDGTQHPKNTLHKLAGFPAVWFQEQSWSWMNDVSKCVEAWGQGKIPSGTYHVNQPETGKIFDLARMVNPTVKPLHGHIHQEAPNIIVQRSCAQLDSTKIQKYVSLTPLRDAWKQSVKEYKK